MQTALKRRFAYCGKRRDYTVSMLRHLLAAQGIRVHELFDLYANGGQQLMERLTEKGRLLGYKTLPFDRLMMICKGVGLEASKAVYDDQWFTSATGISAFLRGGCILGPLLRRADCVSPELGLDSDDHYVLVYFRDDSGMVIFHDPDGCPSRCVIRPNWLERSIGNHELNAFTVTATRDSLQRFDANRVLRSLKLIARESLKCPTGSGTSFGDICEDLLTGFPFSFDMRSSFTFIEQLALDRSELSSNLERLANLVVYSNTLNRGLKQSLSDMQDVVWTSIEGLNELILHYRKRQFGEARKVATLLDRTELKLNEAFASLPVGD